MPSTQLPPRTPPEQPVTLDPRRVLGPLQQFLETEVAGGAVLGLAALAALIWANAAGDSYTSFWETDLALAIGDRALTTDLRHVVVDGLMVLFFFVVGMEIKREMTVGELRERRVALLPVFAAAGGMLVPALAYLAITAGDGAAARGWGIPMATDIAFALGALALVSKHVPTGLGAFLLAVAVVDDIGAILVIAFFYSAGLQVFWLGIALAGLAVIAVMVRAGVQQWPYFLAAGLVVWAAVAESGVHPTIAGVLVGLLMPVRPLRPENTAGPEAERILDDLDDIHGDHGVEIAAWRRIGSLGREAVPTLERYEQALHPWTSFVVLPTFALAEAGVVINGDVLDAALTSSITLGVVVGLVGGKIAGIFLGAWLPTRLGLTDLPTGLRWPHIVGAGALAGIGFTVAIFVAGLAFESDLLVEQAKFGILVASLAAGLIGTLLLRLIGRDDGAPAGERAKIGQ